MFITIHEADSYNLQLRSQPGHWQNTASGVWGGRMRVRWGVAIILALALGGCASRSVGLAAPPDPPPGATAQASRPTGQWRFARAIDRATGKPIGQAFVTTDQVTPLPGKLFALPADVQLQCFKSQPIVLFAFRQKVGSNRSARLTYRFDDKPPREADVHFLRDQKSIEIEKRDEVQHFAAGLRDAKRLFVSIDSLILGPTRAIFPVHDAQNAIETSFADCPLSQSAGRTARAR